MQAHASLVPAIDLALRREAGLPLTWYDVLLELAAAPDGRLRMSDLADRVVLSRTRVSRLVDDLAAEGLIHREGNPDDRRSAYAVITQQGRARFRRAAPKYLSAIEAEFAAGLTDQELHTIAKALRKPDRHTISHPPRA